MMKITEIVLIKKREKKIEKRDIKKLKLFLKKQSEKKENAHAESIK